MLAAATVLLLVVGALLPLASQLKLLKLLVPAAGLLALLVSGTAGEVPETVATVQILQEKHFNKFTFTNPIFIIRDSLNLALAAAEALAVLPDQGGPRTLRTPRCPARRKRQRAHCQSAEHTEDYTQRVHMHAADGTGPTCTKAYQLQLMRAQP
jgi:hypothetical protein